MPIVVEGLEQIKKGFRDFKFSGKRIQQRFLRLIGESTVILLKQSTPVNSGELRDSWRVVGQGADYVEVGTSLIGLVDDLDRGTAPHIILPKQSSVLRFEIGGQEVFATQVQHPGTRPNPFLNDVARSIHNAVIEILSQSLAENHPYFVKLKGIGGKGRKFQQVGRTSAGFKGGVSFAGRSTLVRVGTGRRQLKRRLSLRRRRGSAVSKNRETKVKLG